LNTHQSGRVPGDVPAPALATIAGVGSGDGVVTSDPLSSPRAAAGRLVVVCRFAGTGWGGSWLNTEEQPIAAAVS
jgi:hypothetical protein